jgi:protein tyrosine/serine phosphatase
VVDTDAERWIALDGAVNVRDVGGLRRDGGGVVPRGRLLRSDNLQGLSPRDLRVLVDDLRVRTIIDLRTDAELALEGPGPIAGVRKVVVEHRSLYPETGGHTDIDAETVVPWYDTAGHPEDEDEMPTVRAYLGYLRHRPDSIVAAVRSIALPRQGGAVLVHCAAGKDRTGVVVALALAAGGVAREEILADYLATGERIEAIVARLAASPTYAGEVRVDQVQRHAPRVGALDRTLELLDERHGGPAAWLAEHGLTDEESAALRARLSA